MKKIFAVLLLVPAGLSAQTRTVVSGYVAADAGIPNEPMLVGATLARETGPLAARLSLGFDVSAPPSSSADAGLEPVVSGIGSTDADAMLFLGNPRGGAPLVPYGIVGVGVRGYRVDGEAGWATNYSYGAGFRAPLGAGFSMSGEARYREGFARPVGDVAPAVANGVEIRFGLSVGFGGGAATGRMGARPSSRPLPIPSLPSRPMSASADARLRVAAATLSSAEQFIGVPYTWGGNTPESGFDCSGFIRYVFSLNGVVVPRVARDQARHGTALPLDVSAFEPGDILAFASDGQTVDHTAIYAGRGRIIHSSSSGRGVRYDDLYSQGGQWYLNHLVAARRVLEAGMYAGM